MLRIEKRDYETPLKFQNLRVKSLYEPDLSHVYIDDDGELIEVFSLNKIANSEVKRIKLSDIKKEEPINE